MAAADKTDSFPTKRPPRADSFMRWLDGTLVLRTLLVKPFGPGKEAEHAENQDHDDAHHEREDTGRILQQAVHKRCQRRIQRDHGVKNCDFYCGQHGEDDKRAVVARGGLVVWRFVGRKMPLGGRCVPSNGLRLSCGGRRPQ